jgi:glycine/D-amino acid oxidase-like deaminating enzyme
MQYQHKSLWLESLADRVKQNASLEGEEHADVVIIGGGFTGLSAAWHLKKFRPKLNVKVLESHICGYGASGRNAGFSTTMFGLCKELTQKRFGKEKASAAHTYMEEAVVYLEKIIREHNISCDYEKTGYLLTAVNDSQVRRLENEFKILKKWGVTGVERWSKRRLSQELNTDMYKLAWYEPACALLNPVKLLQGLKKMAEDAGVIIYENSPVIEFFKNEKGTYNVKTIGGKVEAEYLVFATNAYSVNFQELHKLQTPVFSHIISTEPLSESQLESINWRTRVGIEDSFNFIHYYRLTKDNRIIIGGGDISLTFGNNFDVDNNLAVFEHLEQHLFNIFPQLKGTKITHKWGGAVSVTTDLAPVIGRIGRDKKVLYSLGCSGHGLSMTTLNGRTLAELICGMETHRTEMFFVDRHVIPWPPEPLRLGATKLIRTALRLQDKYSYSK